MSEKTVRVRYIGTHFKAGEGVPKQAGDEDLVSPAEAESLRSHNVARVVDEPADEAGVEPSPEPPASSADTPPQDPPAAE